MFFMAVLLLTMACSESQFSNKGDSKKSEANVKADNNDEETPSEKAARPEDVTGAYLTCSVTDNATNEYSCGVKIGDTLVPKSKIDKWADINAETIDGSFSKKLDPVFINSEQYHFKVNVSYEDMKNKDFYIVANVRFVEEDLFNVYKYAIYIPPTVNELKDLGSSEYGKFKYSFEADRTSFPGYTITIKRSHSTAEPPSCDKEDGLEVKSYIDKVDKNKVEDVHEIYSDTGNEYSVYKLGFSLCIYNSKGEEIDRTYHLLTSGRSDDDLGISSAGNSSCNTTCAQIALTCVSIGTDDLKSNGQIQFLDGSWDTLRKRCTDVFLHTIQGDCNTQMSANLANEERCFRPFAKNFTKCTCR